MNEDKLPPQNLMAERCVLGCQLLDGAAVDVVREIIKPTDFYSDVNATIQKAIFKLRDGGGELDPVTLANQLESTGDLADIGGAAYLFELLEAVPYSAHSASYAEMVVACFRRRTLIGIGRKLIDGAHDSTKNDVDLTEAAIEAAMKLAEILPGANKTRPRLLSDHVADAIETYRSGQTPTVWWGIPEIDAMIGGMMPGELMIIGGRPSHGKSLVGLQWLDEASRHGIPGLMISEEMSAASLANRSLSTITQIPADDWQNETARLETDVREYFRDRAPILIAEKCSTAAAAERAIARAVQSHGIRIVAVDYAQLLDGDGETKEQRVANVSSRMKSAAMRHDIVILLLAQLNRSIESRDNPAPQLSDLRDSGGLENDADVAIFPFWPGKFDDTYTDRNEYRIYCRKNRNRGIREHVILMKISPQRQRIENAVDDSTDRFEW